MRIREKSPEMWRNKNFQTVIRSEGEKFLDVCDYFELVLWCHLEEADMVSANETVSALPEFCDKQKLQFLVDSYFKIVLKGLPKLTDFNSFSKPSGWRAELIGPMFLFLCKLDFQGKKDSSGDFVQLLYERNRRSFLNFLEKRELIIEKMERK